MNNEDIIFKKEDFIFTKINNYNFQITFNMTNNKIPLEKIVDFGLMRLIYDLNKDIYLTSSIEIIDDNQAIVTLLLNNFFEDLGLPQRYSYVHMTKIVEKNKVYFISKSITNKRPDGIPIEAQLLDIEKLTCLCDIETPNKINFIFNITFDNNYIVPPLFVQKMLGVILNKIFKRVKQFIENL